MNAPDNSTLRRAAKAVILAGAATFAALGLLIVRTGEATKPAMADNPYGFTQAVYWFEVFTDKAELFQILGEPGTEVGTHIRAIMDTSCRWDYPFMAAYTVLFAAIVLFLDRLGSSRGRTGAGTRQIRILGIGLAAVMLVGDALENRQLFALLAVTSIEQVSDGTMTALTVWTRIKWFALFTGSLILAWRYSLVMALPRPGAILFLLLYGTVAAAGVVGILVRHAGIGLELSGTLLAGAWLCSVVHAALVYRRTPVA